jgi:hypothetical protein
MVFKELRTALLISISSKNYDRIVEKIVNPA